MRTFNSIDSVYFVYSLNNKTRLMAFKQGNGVNNKTVVKSNILRHTDGRLYVGTADGIQSINADGSNGPLLPNTGSVSPMFVTVPIIILPGFHIATQGYFAQYSGRKVYELKDHLGNVRATITDRKFLTGGTAPKYQAELVTATDYYAYGSPMKGRIYTTQTGSYRFGFNTQEKVDEVSGEGNHNTAEFWEYDTRLGRRWNVDPIPNENEGSYTCFNDNPMLKVDPDGNSAGDFVGKDGSYLGNDGIDDNKAYVTDQKTIDNNKGKDGAVDWDKVKSSKATTDLTKNYGITASQLFDRAHFAYGEGPGFAKWTACAINNIAKEWGEEQLYAKMTSGKKSQRFRKQYKGETNRDYRKAKGDFLKTVGFSGEFDTRVDTKGKEIVGNYDRFTRMKNNLTTINNDRNAKIAISATVNVIMGGKDITGGANEWVGTGNQQYAKDNDSRGASRVVTAYYGVWDQTYFHR